MNETFDNLYDTVLSRKNEPTEGSYTCYLFSEGTDKILKKVGEECAETLIAVKNMDGSAERRAELVGEICDLQYHLTVLVAQTGITPDEIYAELDKRALKIGNLKKKHDSDKNS